MRGMLGQYVDIYREEPSPEHTMTALSELLTTFLRTKSYIEQLISRHSPGAVLEISQTIFLLLPVPEFGQFDGSVQLLTGGLWSED